MATSDQVIEIFAGQVGAEESPAGSNQIKYGEWYGLNGNPWCAMFVSWCFFQAGLPLPASTEKGFAYTPSGANWFKKNGKWRDSSPQKGDVVFFDFPGDNVNRISHVGIVESVNADGSINTIEGNTDERGGRTGGKVMRRVRKVGIVGYGVPDYAAQSEQEPVPPTPEPAPAPQSNTERMIMELPQLQRGSRGHAVKNLQALINTRGHRIGEDGDFGPATESALKQVQAGFGDLTVDGICGPQTWRALITRF